MSYKNSPAYIQRQIDRLLRRFSFTRIYINDVVIFFRSLIEYVQHLRQVFELFVDANIFINSSKTFLKYFSIQLLEQKIIIEKKLNVIFKLAFSDSLIKLEIYLDIINWLWNYIVNYIAIAKPLQKRKTLILAKFSKSNYERKNFAIRAELQQSSRAEIIVFITLQKRLSISSFLTHFDNELFLYIDLNASKDFDFDVMIYYIVSAVEENYSRRSQIRLILFLSRFLKNAKTRYWSTKLKLAEIV